MSWDQLSSLPIGDQLIIAVQVLIAGVCGAIIGIEREVSGKRAGLRTHVLVAMAGALSVGLGRLLLGDSGGDATRVFHGLLTGIGFIGAGAIITGKRHPGGLTTATTIFFVAILGAACGAGAPLLALFGALVALFLLRGIYLLEGKLKMLVTKVRHGADVPEDDLG